MIVVLILGVALVGAAVCVWLLREAERKRQAAARSAMWAAAKDARRDAGRPQRPFVDPNPTAKFRIVEVPAPVPAPVAAPAPTAELVGAEPSGEEWTIPLVPADPNAPTLIFDTVDETAPEFERLTLPKPDPVADMSHTDVIERAALQRALDAGDRALRRAELAGLREPSTNGAVR